MKFETAPGTIYYVNASKVTAMSVLASGPLVVLTVSFEGPNPEKDIECLFIDEKDGDGTVMKTARQKAVEVLDKIATEATMDMENR